MDMKVRVGVGFGTATALDAKRFREVVDACEGGGWDSIWFSERIASGCPDILAALAVTAGRTERLLFGTSVLVVPGRNPVLLAKQLATIDALSGGRLICVFGLGSNHPSEHQAFGVERGERASWTEEATALIRRLWTEDDVTHTGEHFTVRDLTLSPKPVQEPCPDIWFGGHSAPARSRVARLGTGWLPSFVTPDEYAPMVEDIKRQASEAGREIEEDHYGCLVPWVPEDVDPSLLLSLAEARRKGLDPRDVVCVGPPKALRERLEAFVEVGSTKFVVVPVVEPDRLATELDRLRTTVAEPLENGGR